MNITPSQAGGVVATSLIQSVLSDIEKRRIEEEEKVNGKKEDKALKEKVRADHVQSAANAKINEHFFNQNVVDVNELKVNLVEKLGKQLGIAREDGQSGFSYGRQLESAIAQLDSQAIFALEKTLGLFELGISLDELVKAIKNPYGKEDDKLETALEEQATGVSGTEGSRKKIMQRMESVADPKSIEALKLERAGQIDDPTKIEDAETKAERDSEIGALEAGEKLEDVKDIQEAIKTQNEQAAGKGENATGSPGGADAADIAIEMVQVLAAGAEAIETLDAAPDEGDESLAETDGATRPDASNGDNELALSEKDEVFLLGQKGPDMTDLSDLSLLTVQVDEDGIYDILLRKKAA